MYQIIAAFIICLTFLSPASSFAGKSVSFMSRWPTATSNTIAVKGSATDTPSIFIGKGDIITHLNADLEYQASAKVKTSEGITSVFYSAENDKIYVACGRNYGLEVFNASDLSEPSVICKPSGLFDGTGRRGAHDIYVLGSGPGTLAYVVDGFDRLHIIEVSSQTILSTLSLSTGILGWVATSIHVVAENNRIHAYIGDKINGLHIVDVTNPKNPNYVSLALSQPTVNDIHVTSKFTYMTLENKGLMALDHNGNTADIDVPGQCFGFFYTPWATDTYAFIASGSRGLQMINITDPVNFTIEKVYTKAYGTYGVTVIGDYAYLATAYRGVEKIDLTPEDPKSVGTYNTTPSDADLFAVSNDVDRAYIVNNRENDTTDQADIRIIRIDLDYISGIMDYNLVHHFSVDGQVNDIMASGEYLYLASTDATKGFQVYNILNETQPYLMSFYDTDGNTKGFFADLNYAYLVSDGEKSMEIIDISNKNALNSVGTLSIDATPIDIVVNNNYAYVLTVNPSLLGIVDISNHSAPIAVSSTTVSGTPNQLTVLFDFVYVAAGNTTKNLQVFDVSNKNAPSLVGSYETTGEGLGLSLSDDGKYVFIADGLKGYKMIEVTFPYSPSIVSDWSYNTLGNARRIIFSNGYVHVADGPGGLTVFQLTEKEEFQPTPMKKTEPGADSGCFLRSIFQGFIH